MKNLLIGLSIIFLFHVPHLENVSGLHILKLGLFLNKFVVSLEPGIELIEALVSYLLSALIPRFHVFKTSEEFFLSPSEQILLGLSVLADDHHLWNSFHVVFNVDEHISFEMHIFCLERKLFIPEEGILIHFVNILKHILEFLDKF
jgi:hypothetical protein